MDITFIRYRYLEKTTIWYRWLYRVLPKKWLRAWFLRKRKLKKEKSAEGEFHGIDVELPLEKEMVIKIGEDVAWRFVEREIEEQRRQYSNATFLLNGELFFLYERQESELHCYPYQLPYDSFFHNKSEKVKEHFVDTLFQRRTYTEWTKFFFLKELTEYYRVLYGIRKKVLKLLVIEGEVEETKRVITLLSNHLNYLAVKTKDASNYEALAKEIYEETGLSIIFLSNTKKEDDEEAKGENGLDGLRKEKQGEYGFDGVRKIEERKGQNTTIEIDLNHLYPKANHLRITQRGIWVDQEVLTAILMEQTIDRRGILSEEALMEWKERYGLYLRKIG